MDSTHVASHCTSAQLTCMLPVVLCVHLQAGEFSGAGVYESKLAAFETFVSRTKFAGLALSAAAPTRTQPQLPAGSAAGAAAAGPCHGLQLTQQLGQTVPGTQLSAAAHPHASQGISSHRHMKAANSTSHASAAGAAAGGNTSGSASSSVGRSIHGSLSTHSGSRPRLVVLDDLPHAADPEAKQRLRRALHELATTARCPVALLLTQAAQGSTGGGGSRGGGGAASASASAGGGGGGRGGSGSVEVLHKVCRAYDRMYNMCMACVCFVVLDVQQTRAAHSCIAAL